MPYAIYLIALTGTPPPDPVRPLFHPVGLPIGYRPVSRAPTPSWGRFSYTLFPILVSNMQKRPSTKARAEVVYQWRSPSRSTRER